MKAYCMAGGEMLCICNLLGCMPVDSVATCSIEKAITESVTVVLEERKRGGNVLGFFCGDTMKGRKTAANRMNDVSWNSTLCGRMQQVVHFWLQL